VVAGRSPNIIFILSDDLVNARNSVQHRADLAVCLFHFLFHFQGYGDYQASATAGGTHGRIQTPNILKMAESGMRFLQSYSGPICAP
jgi:arylsulfatase A-like enzyme